MPTLDDIVTSQTSLTAEDLEWLEALVADWQILADLSFSDLLLWVQDAGSTGMWAAAQIRPMTGPTSLLEDVAGTFLANAHTEVISRVLKTGEIVEAVPESSVYGTRTTRVEFAPVTRDGRRIAVIVRRHNETDLRDRSLLESMYLAVSNELLDMIGRGEFPDPKNRSELSDSLRVGDGFLRVDALGSVTYASPNAVSAYRHLGLSGDLVGMELSDVTARLIGTMPIDPSVQELIGQQRAGETELVSRSASLLMRVIPLRVEGIHDGSLILLRDVTELRSRERELVSKEATIREIHHRVKNNLQTVAALLRLQGRRSAIPEAREALEEAVRRVGSIALVHETLSQSFDDTVPFDQIADRLLPTILDVAGEGVRGRRVGTFGTLPGEVAMPLAMVLTELIQNAAEHGFRERGGTLTIAVNRIRDRLRLRVSDDGVGLPQDFGAASNSLGLSIVSTLVESELGGSLEFESLPGQGTTASIVLDL